MGKGREHQDSPITYFRPKDQQKIKRSSFHFSHGKKLNKGKEGIPFDTFAPVEVLVEASSMLLYVTSRNGGGGGAPLSKPSSCARAEMEDLGCGVGGDAEEFDESSLLSSFSLS